MHNSKKSSTFAADFAPMSEQNHHIIDLSRLPIGTHSFDIQLDDDFFASLEKSEILSGKVSAKVTLNLREEDYQLNIAVRGTVFVVCDRCLDPMPLEIDDEQEIFSEDEEDISDFLFQGNDCFKFQNSNLDLTWLAYEIVSINIPIVHSHQAGECNEQMELLLHNHLCAEPDPDC
ncbi:MAG: DUF177 domain-containing protein [Paludibacteraceae bacterium]|nr:DUF177 domain-containing protein [Paludibacteraceae bacterium]